MDNITKNKARFKKLIMSIEREGINDLMNWLEDTTFYNDPASSSYHNNLPGGLVHHSLSVYNLLKFMVKMHKLDVHENSIKIIALFHDLVKVGSYKIITKNIKNEKTNNKWQSINTYGYNEEHIELLPHGAESVRIIEQFMPLTDEEKLAIYYHMGSFNQTGEYLKAMGKAIEKYPIVLLTHHADHQSSVLYEKIYPFDEIPGLSEINL